MANFSLRAACGVPWLARPHQTLLQGGGVAWVAFWAFYGQGVGVETFQSVWTFGLAYMLVVIIEPIADLAVLAGAKALRSHKLSGLFTARLYDEA